MSLSTVIDPAEATGECPTGGRAVVNLRIEGNLPLSRSLSVPGLTTLPQGRYGTIYEASVQTRGLYYVLPAFHR